MTVPRIFRSITNIIVIGCGPHFFGRYLDVLLEGELPVNIVLAVDLKSEEARVRDTMAKRGVTPLRYLFIDDENRNFPSLEYVTQALSGIQEIGQAHAVLICTEPKAHKAYALWALENKLSVFMDKPITAPTNDADSSLMADYKKLKDAANTNKRTLSISCERRMQRGYDYVQDFMTRFIEEHEVPVTSIHVHFGGGKWVRPSEMETLENHPFKYGYGVLFHSGYHYIDLVARIAKYNLAIQSVDLQNPTVHTIVTRPHRLISAFPKSPVSESIALKSSAPNEDIEKYGELDLLTIGSYEHRNEHRLFFSIDLLETTVCARTPRDSMPGDGRIRQEMVNIHFGHFCSIKIASNSYRKLDAKLDTPEQFNITIARHPKFVRHGEPAVLQVTREHLSNLYPDLPKLASLNTDARRSQLRDFLAGGNANSNISSHEESVALLSSVYESIRVK